MNDSYYNTANFPHFQFVRPGDNHAIWANDRGHCAAIPTAEGAAKGCRATHFGDADYVFCTTGHRVTIPALA